MVGSSANSPRKEHSFARTPLLLVVERVTVVWLPTLYQKISSGRNFRQSYSSIVHFTTWSAPVTNAWHGSDGPNVGAPPQKKNYFMAGNCCCVVRGCQLLSIIRPENQESVDELLFTFCPKKVSHTASGGGPTAARMSKIVKCSKIILHSFSSIASWREIKLLFLCFHLLFSDSFEP